MSNKLPQEPQSEEVDLGQLFNAIGKLFDKLFAFIGKIFTGLFSIIIYTLKPIVDNFKIITIILMIAVVFGFFTDKIATPVYSSDMLVKPYFESKYELANNVNYFNALVNSGNLEKLSAIFEIDTLTAKELMGFEIQIGPETQNDLLKQYNDYIKSIDSTLAKDVTYEEFIDNRDILAGDIFSITALSGRNDVFLSLEKGFIKTFENEYSKKLKEIADSTRLLQKGNYQKQLQRVDSLQRIYLQILKLDSENNDLSIGANGFFPLTKEKSVTKEYDLFKEEQNIRNSIKDLDKQLLERSEFYDILSGFEEIGTIRESFFYKKSIFVFPVISLIIMMLIFVLFKAFKFIKSYE